MSNTEREDEKAKAAPETGEHAADDKTDAAKTAGDQEAAGDGGKAEADADGVDDREDRDGDDEADEDDEPDSDGPLDLASRVLCPDGNCIGVIGPDGRCKECGMALPEAERKTVAAAAAAAAKTESASGASPVEEKQPSPRGDDDPLDFSKRRLCSDGSCIGVIGSDGRCKECGKPYQGEPED